MTMSDIRDLLLGIIFILLIVLFINNYDNNVRLSLICENLTLQEENNILRENAIELLHKHIKSSDKLCDLRYEDLKRKGKK